MSSVRPLCIPVEYSPVEYFLFDPGEEQVVINRRERMDNGLQLDCIVCLVNGTSNSWCIKREPHAFFSLSLANIFFVKFHFSSEEMQLLSGFQTKSAVLEIAIW